MILSNFQTISYTTQDILKNFSSKDYGRGRSYAAQGRVRNIKFIDNNHLTAEVQGTKSRPYKVDIKIFDLQSKKTISGTCSCPMEINCKHVVATLISTIEQLPYKQQSGGNIIDVTPIENAPESLHKSSSAQLNSLVNTTSLDAVKEVELDNTLACWLEDLNQSVTPILDKSSKELDALSQKMLIYIISPSKGREAFNIAPIAASILKSGLFSTQKKAYRIDNVESYNRSKYVEDEDVTILRLILAFTSYSDRYNSSFKIPAGDSGLILFKLALATDKCYVENETNPQNKLTIGEPKTGTIGWEIDSSGVQSIKISRDNLNPESQDSESFIIKFEPLYYLCPVTYTVGILKTDLPNKQVAALLNAPRIRPEQSAVFSQKLAAIFGDDNKNLLPAILPIRKVNVKPLPSLKLKVVTIHGQKYSGWIRQMGQEILLPVATILFNYEEQSIAYNDEKREFSIFKDGEVLTIPRDRTAEVESIKQLHQSGLNLILKDLHYHYHVSSEFSYALTIGQVKENFHKDKKLSRLWMDFMRDSIPLMKEQGWRIEIEPSFPYNIVYADDEYYAQINEQINESSGIDWFAVELGVYIEGKRFNLVPILLDLLKKDEDILTIIANLPIKAPFMVLMEDGRSLAIPSERAKILLTTLQNLFSFHNALDEEGRLRLQLLEAALLAEIEAAASALNMRWHGGDRIRELGNKLKDFKAIKKIPVPAIFNGQLRPYQLEGLNWLQFLREYSLAGILADDMGLGKTVQLLAHIATEKEAKRLDQPVLVIATTSLMINWKTEVLRFVPSLKTLILHGSSRKVNFKNIKEFDLIFTTYPLLTHDKDELLAYEYSTLILDEAQNIKNAGAKITQIVNQIKARHRICMTGTPLENHLGELWSLFNFLLPGYLGSKQQFSNIFRTPIEKRGNAERSQILTRRIKPFVLRRTKQEVVTELPPKTEIVRMVKLEGAQRDLYETVRIAMQQKIQEAISSKGVEKSHIIVLDALLKLRLVCCDPSLLKLEPAKNINESAKRNELINMLTQMLEEGRKILLFSQFTTMLELIENELVSLKIPYVKLTGQTKDRETPIKNFQEGRVSLFLISLKAGGVGLNLTAADSIIHYDPWWNPAVENQATDRAYRIGQDKPVFVYKLITEGTVEEKIIEMQHKKRKLIDNLFDPLAKSSVKLSANDLQILFEPL